MMSATTAIDSLIFNIRQKLGEKTLSEFNATFYKSFTGYEYFIQTDTIRTEQLKLLEAIADKNATQALEQYQKIKSDLNLCMKTFYSNLIGTSGLDQLSQALSNDLGNEIKLTRRYSALSFLGSLMFAVPACLCFSIVYHQSLLGLSPSASWLTLPAEISFPLFSFGALILFNVSIMLRASLPNHKNQYSPSATATPTPIPAHPITNAAANASNDPAAKKQKKVS